MRGSTGKPLDVDWEIPLAHGIVTVRPDYIALAEGPAGKSLVVRRWRTGKRPKKLSIDDIYSLYARGAELSHADARISIEALYLSTNEVEAIVLNDKQMKAGIGAYDDALADILRGDFSPTPSDWICPRCPHYFICPSDAFRKEFGKPTATRHDH